MMRIAELSPDPGAPFPDPRHALREPDGLLAYGGDLSPQRLLNAYAAGIFPWYSDGQPLLWWSPDPRTVFRTDAVRLSSRFRRSLRHSRWVVTADAAFEAVIDTCATTPRPGQPGTWITPEMREAYCELHRRGHAHSIEVWDGRDMVGGLYGVAIGRMFFGESMVSPQSGGSKVALAALAARLHDWGWPLLDAQIQNPHLSSLGASTWTREQFLTAIAPLVAMGEPTSSWQSRFGDFPASELAASRGAPAP